MNFKVFLILFGLSMPFLRAAEVYRGTNPSSRNKSMLEGQLKALLTKHGIGGEIVFKHIIYHIWPQPETEEVVGQKVYPPMTPKDFCAITGTDAIKFINHGLDADRYYAYYTAFYTAFEKVTPEVRTQEFRPLAKQLGQFYRAKLEQELDLEEARQQNLNYRGYSGNLSENNPLLEVD